MDEMQIDDPYPKLGRKQFIFISKCVTMQRMRRDKKALRAPDYWVLGVINAPGKRPGESNHIFIHF